MELDESFEIEQILPQKGPFEQKSSEPENQCEVIEGKGIRSEKKKSLLDLQKEEENELQRKRQLYKATRPSPRLSQGRKMRLKKAKLMAAQKMLLMDLEAEEEEEEGESLGSDDSNSDDLLDEEDGILNSLDTRESLFAYFCLDLSGFIANNDSFDFESASEEDSGAASS